MKQIIRGDIVREDYRSGINFTPLPFSNKHKGRNQKQNLISMQRDAQSSETKEQDFSTNPTLPELFTARDEIQEMNSDH